MATIDEFIAAIAQASVATADVFCEDTVLDATVPNWRFRRRGSTAVRRELADWFATPGAFEGLQRTPLPDGELVEFTLTWEEQGVPHAAHQVHVLQLRNGRIGADTVFCGGRWSASLLATMEAAQEATDREHLGLRP